MKRHGSSGFTTIEMVIVLALLGFVLMSLIGLHLVAISAGTAAETSSIAANLARARMEELLAMPPEELRAQDHRELRREIPPEAGPTPSPAPWWPRTPPDSTSP